MKTNILIRIIGIVLDHTPNWIREIIGLHSPSIIERKRLKF